MTRGICVNHAQHCRMFEVSVEADEGDHCIACGQLLLHESGLTWADAQKAEATLTGVTKALRDFIGGREVPTLHQGYANELQGFCVEIQGYSFSITVERNPGYNGRLAPIGTPSEEKRP